ncbi:hypothetical protein D3C78_1578260 [compost metagenome]
MYRNPGVRKQDGQQHQIRQNQCAHANPRRERQVADDLNVDHREHGEAQCIGQQGGQPGNEQASEGVPRGDDLVRTACHVVSDTIHLLGAVAGADREHQERDQYRVRVKHVAQLLESSESPQHRDQ